MYSVKEDKFHKELSRTQPELLIVLGYVCRFATDRGLEVVITNVLDDANGSTSETHSSGRAFDVSTKGWSLADIAECLCFTRTKCGELGAISYSNNQPNVIIYHKVEGSEYHLHCQVRS